MTWCAREDSNLHDVTRCHLKAVRLPIPPRARFEGRGLSDPLAANKAWARSAWRAPVALLAHHLRDVEVGGMKAARSRGSYPDVISAALRMTEPQRGVVAVLSAF